MSVGYSPEGTQLLADIRDDILARPDFYREGGVFLETQYGPDALHAAAMADWERCNDHGTHVASTAAAAAALVESIEDPAERQVEYQTILSEMKAPPKRERWTAAACARSAVDDMLSRSGETHNDTRAKAVCILAVLLWDENADRRHPLFELFGPWGISATGEMTSVSRWAAGEIFGECDSRRRQWVEQVRAAWNGLAKLASTPDVDVPNGPRDTPKAQHSADFTFVNWFGTEYTFALGVQATAVKALWVEWEKTGLGLHQDTIRNAVDAERDNFRMDKAFRNHPAFTTMIRKTGDGRYTLAPPGTGKAPNSKAKRSAGIPSKARQRPR